MAIAACPSTSTVVQRAVAILSVLALAASPLLAANRYWIDPAGGTFGASSNWSATAGGAGGASVPGPADIANFTLGNFYALDFFNSHVNHRLDVENGGVMLDLNNQVYTLQSTSAARVGAVPNQTGRLTVTDGILAVDTVGDDIVIVNNLNSAGFLAVSSKGRINGNPDLFIGNNGSGSLTIAEGGDVTSSATSIANGLSSSLGSASITGAGSTWTNSGQFTIGTNGTGTVTIGNGGSVSTNGRADFGLTSAAKGSALVSGEGSTWSIGSSLTVGLSGEGSLSVTSGGQVNSGGFTLGSSSAAEGRVTISGTGSLLSSEFGTTVASAGFGELIVEDGARFEGTSIATGLNSAGNGIITIRGEGTRWTSGGFTIGNAGNGTVNISDGAEVTINGLLDIRDPAGTQVGVMNLDGGTATVGGTDSNLTVSEAISLAGTIAAAGG